MKDEAPQGYRIDRSKLDPMFPTQLHPSEFWEALGRAVGAFGYLEKTLARAIYMLTATRPAPLDVEEQRAAIDKWTAQLEFAVSGNLRPLIDLFGSALRAHPKRRIDNPEDLVQDLCDVVDYRNMLCHSSWEHPLKEGVTKPLHVNKNKGQFDDHVGVQLFERLRAVAGELACGVMDTVTGMGYRWPSSDGPGIKVG
jgi:hypothetical protein